MLPIDEFRVCYHDDARRLRLPQAEAGPAAAAAARRMWPRSVMVGDRWRDIEAGRARRLPPTIFIDYGYDEALPHEPDVRVRSLAEAADWILTRSTEDDDR